MSSGGAFGPPFRKAARAVWRIVSFTASFVVCAFAVHVAVERATGALEPERGPIALDLIPVLQKWQSALAEDRDHERVALIGDSVLGAPSGHKPLGEALQRAVHGRRRRGSRLRIHSFGWPGFGPVAQYSTADEIVRAKPDRIVLEFNLRALSPRQIGFPELAGWIQGPRLLEAAFLPLSRAGVTVNRLLLYRLLVATGTTALWEGLLDRQARVRHLRDRAEVWLEKKTGSTALADRNFMVASSTLARALAPGKNRVGRWPAERVLGPALRGVTTDHPALSVLRATLRRYREGGTPVLVWVAPLNVEHLRSLGLSVDGLGRSVAAVESVAKASGARFIDLHAVLPDAAFLDSGDHFTSERTPGPVDRVAKRLGKAILAGAKPARTSASSEKPGRAPSHAVQ